MSHRSIIPNYLIRLWTGYRNYVEHMNPQQAGSNEKNLQYWRNQLFTSVVLYAFPMAIFVTLLSVGLECATGKYSSALLDLASTSLVAIVLLNHKLSLNFRKHFTAGMIVLFSIAKITLTGLLEVGGIYLMALSIFFALSFSGKMAYLSVLLNGIICAGFALLIGLEYEGLSLHANYELSDWLNSCANFIFINLSTVILIVYLSKGLEDTINHAHAHARDVQVQNDKLKDIAYLHSHQVRAPLAKILGLVDLLSTEMETASAQQLLHFLDESTKELDTVLTDIVDHAKAPVLSEPPVTD